MGIELQRAATKTEHGWIDVDGFAGPVKPGTGPRSDPAGAFPTGPGIGDRLPPIVAADHAGNRVNVQSASAGRPAVMVFFRSAVW